MKKIGTAKYLNLLPAIQPFPHLDSLTVSTPPQSYELEAENEDRNEVEIEGKKKETSLPHQMILILC